MNKNVLYGIVYVCIEQYLAEPLAVIKVNNTYLVYLNNSFFNFKAIPKRQDNVVHVNPLILFQLQNPLILFQNYHSFLFIIQNTRILYLTSKNSSTLR